MMRIKEVNIPKDFENDGLEDIKMQRLGQIVVLVGKNGAGKTRLLSKLRLAMQKWSTPSQVEHYNKNIDDLKRSIVKQYGERGLQNQNIYEHQEINRYEIAITNHSFLKADEALKSIEFVPKTTLLGNPEALSMAKIAENANRITELGMSNIHIAALANIQHTQNLYYETFRPDYKDDLAKNKAVIDYENLKTLIKQFLSTDIHRNTEGSALFFDRKLGDAQLSDGQSILLQLIMAIYRQTDSLGKRILLMDEPENHMHPSAIIEALNKIIEATKESQVWIATHSLPIIAYLASLPETSIYYVEDGKVSFAGSTPEKVLEGLLGDEEQIGKLHDFIGLPAQYAINLYAYQCLFEPAVVETGADDPQTNQIKSVLDGLRKDKSLKLLDYGAGKGRLLANIVETNKELLHALDYVAFDKFATNKSYCEDVITSAYEHKPNSYYNSMVDLKAIHKGSFDVVLLCNVLHEIPPSEWLDLIKSITALLNENGILLIVEDSQIPIGEKAHQHGFIVFDEAQIRELFAIGSANDFISQQHSIEKSRLKAHLIPMKYLANISEKTRKEALKSLNEKAKEEINKLRGLDPKSLTFKQGREHAFWVQQFANTQLALDTM